MKDLMTLCKGIADEADLFIRIQKKGCTVILVPDARVTHYVHLNRLKFLNIIRRAFLVGRSQLILDQRHSPFINIGVSLWSHLQRSLKHEMIGPLYVALPVELSLWLGYLAEKFNIIKHKHV
jgi:GT2 family glycosyltransferase